jgi:hypothetical protein
LSGDKDNSITFHEFVKPPDGYSNFFRNFGIPTHQNARSLTLDECSPEVFLLQLEQIPFMIRIFFQDQGKAVALRQVGTLITILAAPIDGADTDEAAIHPPPASAPGAFRMGEKPLQALAEFRQGKTLVAPKTMRPPVNPKLVHEAFHLGNGF